MNKTRRAAIPGEIPERYFRCSKAKVETRSEDQAGGVPWRESRITITLSVAEAVLARAKSVHSEARVHLPKGIPEVASSIRARVCAQPVVARAFALNIGNGIDTRPLAELERLRHGPVVR